MVAERAQSERLTQRNVAATLAPPVNGARPISAMPATVDRAALTKSPVCACFSAPADFGM